MDVFWHNIRVILFAGFPSMSLAAFAMWKHYFYEYKNPRMDEKKRKRAKG